MRRNGRFNLALGLALGSALAFLSLLLARPVDDDSFLWQTVDRTMDGESLADVPQVKVARVKGK